MLGCIFCLSFNFVFCIKISGAPHLMYYPIYHLVINVIGAPRLKHLEMGNVFICCKLKGAEHR